MRKVNSPTFGTALILLFLVSFLTIGGCDVEFGGGGNNGGGGGGGGSSNPEIVQGTIIDIIPDEDTEGITVVITNKDNVEFMDTTNSAGFFSISSGTGTFAGIPRIEFFSGTLSLGFRDLNVFPTAKLELGNITLENGGVTLSDILDVTFEGDVITNTCVGNSGIIEVEASREGESTDVIVQISASTDILRDSDEILCEEVLIGQRVEIRGILQTGNNVDGDFIDLL